MRKHGEQHRGNVDWTDVRRRLDAAERAARARATAETADVVLAERARLLAQPAHERAGDTPGSLVTLRLGGETWGLEARFVWEVFKLTELARLPGADAPVAGVTHRRGLILPALDLRSVLGMPTALDDLRFAVLVGADRPALAILADAVDEIRPVAEGEIVEVPDGVAVRRDYVLGMTRASVPVLDIPRLLHRFG